jgi:DNA polymerase V
VRRAVSRYEPDLVLRLISVPEIKRTTMSTSSNNRGGYRPGAGRPSGEPTQRVRVPESQVSTVVAYLDAYRQATIAADPVPVSANPSSVGLTAFASRIPAGFPSPAQDYLDDTVDLNEALIIQGHEAATFVLRVQGWSMMNAGIFDGDRIVVDRALEPQQGDVVVAVLNNDLTVKRLGMVDGRLALLPENPHFKPILLDEGDTLEVWGVVTNCLRSFRRGGR